LAKNLKKHLKNYFCLAKWNKKVVLDCFYIQFDRPGKIFLSFNFLLCICSVLKLFFKSLSVTAVDSYKHSRLQHLQFLSAVGDGSQKF